MINWRMVEISLEKEPSVGMWKVVAFRHDGTFAICILALKRDGKCVI